MPTIEHTAHAAVTKGKSTVPTYQYACTACDHRFEIVQAFSDSSLTTCPECEGRLRKLFGSVGIVFKGSGFYHTDSRANGSNGDGSSEKSESSSKSESAKSESGKSESGKSESSNGGSGKESSSSGGSGSGNGSGDSSSAGSSSSSSSATQKAS